MLDHAAEKSPLTLLLMTLQSLNPVVVQRQVLSVLTNIQHSTDAIIHNCFCSTAQFNTHTLHQQPYTQCVQVWRQCQQTEQHCSCIQYKYELVITTNAADVVLNQFYSTPYCLACTFVMPPSTPHIWPVMKSLSGCNKNSTTLAMSFGSPTRPIGCKFSDASL